MSYDDLGQSFLPRGRSGRDSGPGSNRLEDILQVHNFRLPRILGARPIAPSELLTAQGGNDPLGRAIASGVLSNLFKGSPSPTDAQMAQDADPGAPSPLSNLMAQYTGSPQAVNVGGPGSAPTPKINFLDTPKTATDSQPPPIMPDMPGFDFESIRRQLGGGRQRLA
jgi:hypothetical protein